MDRNSWVQNLFVLFIGNFLQSVTFLKNLKISIFEIAMPDDVSKIIPAQIALDTKQSLNEYTGIQFCF